MDAPTYPPAATYVPPVLVEVELSTETASLAELRSSPAAWAIVLKHAPALEFAINSPMAKPYVGNFTLATFVGVGVVDQKSVDAIDAELRALPRKDWPTQ